jgi:antitoxin ParD1/3/4
LDKLEEAAILMQTMNISLPDPMKQYVEEQVSAGGYSSASEYVRELVRADQKRKDKDQLEQVLIQSLRSGEAIDITPEMLEGVRKRLRSRAKGRGPAKP